MTAVTVLDITIDEVAGGTPFTASAVAPVGFAEIETPGSDRRSRSSGRPWTASGTSRRHTARACALTRLRIDPMDRWRDDPEPMLVREIELARHVSSTWSPHGPGRRPGPGRRTRRTVRVAGRRLDTTDRLAAPCGCRRARRRPLHDVDHRVRRSRRCHARHDELGADRCGRGASTRHGLQPDHRAHGARRRRGAHRRARARRRRRRNGRRRSAVARRARSSSSSSDVDTVDHRRPALRRPGDAAGGDHRAAIRRGASSSRRSRRRRRRSGASHS